ncbi:MAG: hypothetical protein NWE93_03080 [Candidatus Bathyarchaeota archaeon]|nr:hypothetical protein [Candidatus Bathyarchaeota archaeon]
MYDGYVFFCTKASQQQCLSSKHYSCAEDQPKPEGEIKEGSVIFLYNTDDRTLLGPFTALTEGATELDAGTWAMDVDEHVPSEDLKVTWEELHVIKNAPAELPFLSTPKTCRLSTLETQRVLDLLKQGELYLTAKEKQEP